MNRTARLAIGLLLFLCTPTFAQDDVTLSSGEILAGEVVKLRGDKVTFKSKDLGEIQIPLGKITSLETTGSATVVIGEGETAETIQGRLQLENGNLKVIVADGDPRDVALSTVTSINPDEKKTELDYWNFRGTIGATLLYGNTRSRSFGALVGIVRQDEYSRLFVGATSIYATDDDNTETAKAHRLDGQLDINVTDRFYVTPFVGHVLYDKFQNIDLRYRLGAGVGYRILKEDTYYWRVEGGFAYSFTNRRDPVAGEKDKTYETNIRAATAAGWKITDVISVDVFYETYLGAKNIKDTVHRVVGNLAWNIIDGVAFSFATIYDRIERPGRDTDGDMLKKDDVRFVIGVSLSI